MQKSGLQHRCVCTCMMVIFHWPCTRETQLGSLLSASHLSERNSLMAKRKKIEFPGSPIFYSLRCITVLRAGCKKSIDNSFPFIRSLQIINFGIKHYLKA